MTTHNLELQYFFDPLCGWCYTSAPALTALAERHGAALQMMPIGLFMQPRPIAGIADFAWQNDQRIAALTGQRFTESYRTQVLQAADGVFDSTPLTRALTALAEQHAAGMIVNVTDMDTVRELRELAPGVSLAPASGSELARRLQIAHYPVLITDTGLTQQVKP